MTLSPLFPGWDESKVCGEKLSSRLHGVPTKAREAMKEGVFFLNIALERASNELKCRGLDCLAFALLQE
jgi:hypothetical protein